MSNIINDTNTRKENPEKEQIHRFFQFRINILRIGKKPQMIEYNIRPTYYWK